MASPWAETSATEALPTTIWAAEEPKGAIFGGEAPLCLREKVGEVLLRLQRGQRPHQEQRRVMLLGGGASTSPENFFLKTEIAHEGGSRACSLPCRPFDQRPLHQQDQCEKPRYGQATGIGGENHHVGICHPLNRWQQQWGGSGPAMGAAGYSGKTTGNGWSCGQGYGEGLGGCGEMAGGEMVVASPRSSVSSAESWASGGGLVDNSPSAVWELDSTGEGDDGGVPAERKRKRSMGAVAESGVALQQLQMIRLRESSASLHNNAQGIDRPKKLLLYGSMEPVSTRASAKEEIRKKEDTVQVLQPLKMTGIETEARELIQELRNKIAQPSPSPPEHPPSLSGVSEFDELSFTDSHQPYSPLSDMVSTTQLPSVRCLPNSSNIAMSRQPLLPEYSSSMAMEIPVGTARFDRASAIIDALVVEKPLPKQGKLLEAVMDAGPLLQTLLVAGPLPQWRNPPPLKPFQMPPVSVTACKSGAFDQNALLKPNGLVESSAEALCHQNSLVASRLYAASFMKPTSLSTMCTRVPVPSTCASCCKVPIGKNQKI